MTSRKIRKTQEAVAKGFANHRRLQIMELLAARKDLTLEEITRRLRIDRSTASEHTRRLVLGGQITKRYRGRQVLHRLTPLGIRCLKFMRSVVDQ